MKIIELHAENVKRLKAVQIIPGEHVQVIAGRNAQGKTSVLDSIWLALGGGAASKANTRPVRDGEDAASVRLDLGEYIVTRTWKGDKTALTVESGQGGKFGSPQKILDGLVGKLSFDPLAFTQLTPSAQRDTLLSLVELPFDLTALDHRRLDLYGQRTEVGRDAKAMGAPRPMIPGIPEAEVSMSDIVARIRHAETLIHAQADDRAARDTYRAEVDRLEAQLSHTRGKLEELQAQVDAHETPPDLSGLEDELSQAEVTNANVRTNADTASHTTRQQALHDQYASLNDRIAGLDKEKAAGLAKAKFPVEGLGFDDAGVTYNDVPFAQASSAEQIRVSLAMAMSLNPRLRVIRIMDGSLLDADNMALIADMIAEQDYQLWIEVVQSDDTSAVLIEDGAVKS